MATRCLLVSENDLMVAGVRKALAPFTDLEVYLLPFTNGAEMQSAVEAMQPEVIILDEHTLIAQFANLLQLLKNASQSRIVVINHDDNSLNVYQGKRFEVHEASDLGIIVRN